ncbi:hypothetical protein EYF80_000593 [Liparis tanakae]|uniref:Uncharacterized protein n=1 Tax=Liparis tanakae TaxID=230148 RepID=A0A4Z2JGD1_9TELE|nr:hypothetical protein EYF80_000593 [Liparis tanakae]
MQHVVWRCGAAAGRNQEGEKRKRGEKLLVNTGDNTRRRGSFQKGSSALPCPNPLVYQRVPRRDTGPVLVFVNGGVRSRAIQTSRR